MGIEYKMVTKIKSERAYYNLRSFVNEILDIDLNRTKVIVKAVSQYPRMIYRDFLIIYVSKTTRYIIPNRRIMEYLYDKRYRDNVISLEDIYIYNPTNLFFKKQEKRNILNKDLKICFEVDIISENGNI